MKKAFLLAPLIAALFFAVPEAWQQIVAPGPGYVPVVNEALLLLFGYLVAVTGNALVIVPLCLLVRMKTRWLPAGVVLGLLLALIITTVAYAFEIFDYQSSIFHPAYLYPLFIPLFVLTVLSFYFLGRPVRVAARAAKPEAEKQEAP